MITGIGLSQPSYLTHANVGQPLYALTVTGSGSGSGTVTSNLYGINCTSIVGVESGSCTVLIPMGTTIVLTTTPGTGNIFNGWTGSGCTIGTCSVLIDGNKTVDANFLNIPSANLWAWFKFNEGSGLTIVDYSGSGAGNGAWVTAFGNPLAKVWSIPGFGHNDLGAPTTWVLRTSAARNVSSVTAVGFVKPKGAPTLNVSFYGAQQLGGGGGANWIRYGWDDFAPFRWQLASGNAPTTTAGVSPVFGTWYFVAARCTFNTGNVTLDIRQSGGALTNLLSVARTGANNGTQTSVYSFGGNNNDYNMDGGDMLYYAGVDSSARLTDAQLDQIYQSLKSRHGML